MQATRSRRGGTKTTCPRPCERCRTAARGEMCHTAVAYAMEHLIWTHPEWYPGLSANSSFEDFQELLHTRNLERCAMPCLGHHGPPLWSDGTSENQLLQVAGSSGGLRLSRNDPPAEED